ncbi:MAG: hypothetical protein M3T49_03310 [Candidatus Eremiobacteraeota bacterium]|nr:hypothetical protein [Candidatus Eremiobacteraeota bacterium]
MKKLQTLVAAALIVSVCGISSMQAARADQAARTRNMLLGAAAIAGLAIESNVAHKNRLANTVEGYLPNGGTVYQDGHVVLANGQSYYPGNYGQTVACDSYSCYISGGNGSGPYYGYNGNSNGYPPYGNNGNSPYYGYDTTAYANQAAVYGHHRHRSDPH